jgi:hypothetical protein
MMGLRQVLGDLDERRRLRGQAALVLDDEAALAERMERDLRAARRGRDADAWGVAAMRLREAAVHLRFGAWEDTQHG